MATKIQKTALAADKLLTIEDVVRLLDIRVYTVKQAIQNGKLEAMKFGHDIRISPEALEKYKESQRVKVEVAAK